MNLIEQYFFESRITRRICDMLARGTLPVPQQKINGRASHISYHTERRLEHSMPPAYVGLLAMSVYAQVMQWNQTKRTYRVHIINNCDTLGIPENYVMTGYMAKRIYRALSRVYYTKQYQK